MTKHGCEAPEQVKPRQPKEPKGSQLEAQGNILVFVRRPPGVYSKLIDKGDGTERLIIVAFHKPRKCKNAERLGISR